ncbi:hypothetical protein GCM10010912_23100 [Paenibacillus albidus]|uniref:Uncharacterized protein n=1 Tax=Paenibacillus albidus TaxID=2041023 RepID=A0A917C9I3_9BACL|nr:hypothetical protein GCM10010912_23100 [Paenibacillus albidus]
MKYFFLCNLTVSLLLISYSYIITINKLWEGSTLNKLLFRSTKIMGTVPGEK